MGFLTKHVELESYNKTIKDLKKDIKILKIELEKKPSDDIKAARHALSKCTEYKNRCEENQKNIYTIQKNISVKESETIMSFNNIKEYHDSILRINQLSLETEIEINTLKDKIYTVDTLFENRDTLHSNIEELSGFYENGTDLANKIDAIYKGIKSKKNEIESLSYEILGYDEEDEEDKTKLIHINGLKDTLEKSYGNIIIDLEQLKKSLIEIDATTTVKYDDFIEKKEQKFTSLVHEVEELLPKALTAGLSHAYSKKRIEEKASSKILTKNFIISIRWLVAISLIPFMVSIYLLVSGTGLINVIEDMPRMVLSILPLYIPIVWLAYSSNKKINLSKRLIEEYTHKEVLSKTFEGLSKQIENIEDKELSSELKIKLLHNILSVSSENPGKLISNYNTADHPLMDALEKSAKLNDAIDSISKIPGLSKLSKILEGRAEKINKIEEEKTSSGLEDIEISNKEPNK